MEFEDITSISHASEHEISSSRRWPRIRRAGQLATRAAGENFLDSLDVGIAEEFGVADNLQDYAEGWSAYGEVISEFLGDEDNYETFDKAYAQTYGPTSDRYARKRRDSRLEKDFTDIATIFVLHGRVIRTYRQDVVDTAANRPAEADQGLVGTVLSANKTISSVTGKRDGLMANFKGISTRETMQKKFEGLGRNVSDAYKPVLKTEDKIIEKLQGQVNGNPLLAKRLLEGFVQANESEALEERMFVKFLSTEFAVNPSGSVLYRAIEAIKAGAERGTIAKDFMQERMDENEGNNQLRFFADMLAGQGLDIPFSAYMAAKFEEWPGDLKQDYDAFKSQFIASLGTAVQRIAAQSIENLWVHPTIDMYEEMLDRTFNRLHGKYAFGNKKARVGDGSKVRIGSSLSLRTEDVLPDERFEEEVKACVPVIIAKGIEGRGVVWSEDSTVPEVVARLLPKNRKNNPGFVAEVSKLLEQFLKNPFGKGSQLLRGQTGKSKFYRINPVHASIAVKHAKEARIIYTVEDGRFGVYSITADHQDYDQTVGNLLKARL